jgi:hypothetical protein
MFTLFEQPGCPNTMWQDPNASNYNGLTDIFTEDPRGYRKVVWSPVNYWPGDCEPLAYYDNLGEVVPLRAASLKPTYGDDNRGQFYARYYKDIDCRIPISKAELGTLNVYNTCQSPPKGAQALKIWNERASDETQIRIAADKGEDRDSYAEAFEPYWAQVTGMDPDIWSTLIYEIEKSREVGKDVAAIERNPEEDDVHNPFEKGGGWSFG